MADTIPNADDPGRSAAEWRHRFDRFPNDPKPHWFLGLARALRSGGDYADAEATLHRCRERFPDYSPAAVALAELLAGTGRSEAAESAWRTVLELFLDTVKPWWFVGLAAALHTNGRFEEEERVVAELARRFPDTHFALVCQARVAAAHDQWAQALELWTICCERHTDKIHPEWMSGRADALFRLWEPERALAAWQEAIDRFPQAPLAYGRRAAALQEMGHWTDAERCFADLIARFADRPDPQWLAGQAKCLLNQLEDDAAKRVIAELERQFPHSPLCCKFEIELATRLSYSTETLFPLIAHAAQRFPDDRDLAARHIVILLASGQLAEAEIIASKLQSAGDDNFALVSRWQVIMDRDDNAALREAVQESVARRAWNLGEALQLADFLLGVRSLWAVDVALTVLDAAIERYPGRIALLSARGRALAALGRDQAALELIDSVAMIYRTRHILELRAWAAVKRGAMSVASEVWRTLLTETYYPALHAAAPLLNLIKSAPQEHAAGGTTVFTPVLNELRRLGEFLDHHRKLGIRHFVVVDNMSSDGSFEYLYRQPDVTLYRTADDFWTASAGMRWINALIQRHGAGGWCLFADADEAFIYPGWETTPIDQFCAYLDQEGAEGVAAFMLDLYPERLWDEAGQPADHAEHRYYDSDYVWRGLLKPPYRQALGGGRARMIGFDEFLHKLPLVKSSRGAHINNHETTPLRLSEVTGALLHYKLLSLAEILSNPRQPDRRNPFRTAGDSQNMRRYNRYDAKLEKLRNVDLRIPGVSRVLGESLALADGGLMRAPPTFRDWLSRQPPSKT